MLEKTPTPLYQSLVEYLEQLASPEQILGYKVTDERQARMKALKTS